MILRPYFRYFLHSVESLDFFFGGGVVTFNQNLKSVLFLGCLENWILVLVVLKVIVKAVVHTFNLI